MHISKKYQNYTLVFLLAVIIINVIWPIIVHKNTFFKKFDAKEYENKYNKSQWMVKHSKHEISDADLYVYIGNQLVHGHDPSLGNAEVPPLGKYLIGYFTLFSGYVSLFGVFTSVVALILYYLFNKIVFKSSILALVPIVIFSFDTLFKDQIGLALLDMLYLSFLFLTFIFLLKKQYIFVAISSGLFMATKSPFVIPLLYFVIMFYLVFTKSITLKRVVYMPLITFFVYLSSYTKFFVLGHSFIEFLKVQKYMIHFYRIGAKGVFGAVFPLIIIGYWQTWFGKNSFVKDWNILWAITFFMSIFMSYKLLRTKLGSEFMLQILWLIVYFAFLTITPISTRYLLLVLPFLYNLAFLLLLKYRIITL